MQLPSYSRACQLRPNLSPFSFYIMSYESHYYSGMIYKRSNRVVPVEARRRRTLDEQALALAFTTLYRKYADEAYPHFVLPADRELIASVVRKFLRERRDKLGEMYLGSTVFTVGEDELAEITVNKAIELFLQI